MAQWQTNALHCSPNPGCSPQPRPQAKQSSMGVYVKPRHIVPRGIYIYIYICLCVCVSSLKPLSVCYGHIQRLSGHTTRALPPSRPLLWVLQTHRYFGLYVASSLVSFPVRLPAPTHSSLRFTHTHIEGAVRIYVYGAHCAPCTSLVWFSLYLWAL